MEDLFKHYKDLMQPTQRIVENSYIYQMVNSSKLLRENVLPINLAIDAIREAKLAAEAIHESFLPKNLAINTIQERSAAIEMLHECVMQKNSAIDAIQGAKLAAEALHESFLPKNSAIDAIQGIKLLTDVLHKSVLQKNSVIDSFQRRNLTIEMLHESVVQKNLVIDSFKGKNPAIEMLCECVLQKNLVIDAIQGARLAAEELHKSILQKKSAIDAIQGIKLSTEILHESVLQKSLVTDAIQERNTAIEFQNFSRAINRTIPRKSQSFSSSSKVKTQKLANESQIFICPEEVPLSNTAEALCLEVSTPIDDQVFNTKSLNLSVIEQENLTANVESEDIESEVVLIEIASDVQLSQLSTQILLLIAKCNEAVKVRNKTEIFKPTNKLLEVFAVLPGLFPKDKQKFADFVDCLYFLFYEGAGKDNLRFLKEHGGVLDRSDCNLIWCIKHLRNKWLRHDADHGKETDIKKSWSELAQKFKWLGVNHLPITENDFSYLHCRLLKEVNDFLLQILENLIKNQ